jgi:hypothetical protein
MDWPLIVLKICMYQTPVTAQSRKSRRTECKAPLLGLAFDSADNLFVSAGDNGDIIKITPDGKQSTFASSVGEQLSGLAFQPEPPVLRIITQSNAAQCVIGVGGVCGQTIVLQSSADMQIWASLVTNTCTSSSWNYTNNAPQNFSEQFYRALWLQ